MSSAPSSNRNGSTVPVCGAAVTASKLLSSRRAASTSAASGLSSMSASSTAAARAYSSAAGEPEGSRSRIRSALTATTSSAAIATLAESSAWSAI